jgi:hypothetical protein
MKRLWGKFCARVGAVVIVALTVWVPRVLAKVQRR